MKMLSAFLMVCGILSAQSAQAPNPTQQSVNENADRMAAGSTPIYRIAVVERSTKAINYNHRSGSTTIDFRGTVLQPKARGEAKVESKQGYIEVEVEFDALQPATVYGAEYLTYVMWAITPEGRTSNLGEVLLNGTKSKLNVTTELQSFGLIVTAEPYFAVTQPSDVVVLENIIRQDTRGGVQEVDAKYELLKRGQYTLNVNPADIKAAQLDRKVPLELYEARNAVQIARWTGAQRYAAETFEKAVKSLETAEGYLNRKAGRKPIATVAREAVQMAEDARIITVQKIEEELLANERQAGVDRELRAAAATAAAQSEAERVTRDAEGARINAQADAARAKWQNEADRAAAQSEANRLQRQNEAQTAAAQTEADRLKRENDALAAAAQAEAERVRLANDAQRAAAQADLDRAASDKARSEAEKTELRAQLLQQFNAVLQTRDTARGLIVNMSDVLFDTGKYSLRPLAREKLAKVAGIVSGHPGLQLDVEGHTDSVGSDDYNQQLSEHRGGAVRDYLSQQGMAAGSVTMKGLGETQPVASNDTAAGRQQNRRVELVISGEVIGQQIGNPPIAAR
ncbi:MAG TPA: OmpA family protein [Bryobacteraceae bacterium]|nr:OmpA family protein [Bryobacteraceae bacterium]